VFCPKCGERLQGLGAESFVELQESDSPSAQQAKPVSPGPPAAEEKAAPPPAAATGKAEAALGDAITLWEGRYSFRGMIDWVALSALASIAAIVLAIWRSWGGTGWLAVLVFLVLLWGYQVSVYFVRRFGHRYRLTPQTFFHERGILIKSTSPLEIIRIDDIAMKQTLLERLLGVGTIRILSNDTTDPLLVMKGIPDVQNAFATIDQARRAERRRRALRVDSV
jgi:membrane protein YdbS with pleckstrin-like domain